MTKDIYRNVALAQMASPDRLDELVRVTRTQHWVTLAAVFLLLGTAVAWGFGGRLATKAEGKGVVVRAGNLEAVASLAQGQVEKLFVKAGDTVRPGQLVAIIRQPETVEKIRAAEVQLEQLERDARRRSGMRAGATKLELATIQRQREALEQRMAAVRQQIADVNDQIPAYESLLARGLVARQQLLAQTEKKAELESSLSNLRSQLVQLGSDQFKSENAVQQSEMDGDRTVADARTQLELLRTQLALSTEIRSPYAGLVTEVHAQVGSLLTAGGSVLTLQPTAQELEVVAFVPAQRSKDVRPGMIAQIVPTTVKPEEYGFMLGEVQTVAEYPSTDAGIMRVFQNNSLASAMQGGPVHEVRIRLQTDSTTYSGYRWSSSGGAPLKLTPATMASVKIVTREQAPASLVIPGIRSLLGVGQ